MRTLTILSTIAAGGALVLAPAALGAPAAPAKPPAAESRGDATLDQRAKRKAKTTTILRSSFRGTGKYTSSGTVRVLRRGRTRTLVLGSNFRADPDSIRLRTYLATSPTGRRAVDLGAMRERGAQRFRIPARVSLSRHRYVIAWCDAVDEPVGYALLRR